MTDNMPKMLFSEYRGVFLSTGTVQNGPSIPPKTPYIRIDLYEKLQEENLLLKTRVDSLQASLIKAGAKLLAAASAYERYASRHESQGKAEVDPFFSTRCRDLRKAVEQLREQLP